MCSLTALRAQQRLKHFLERRPRAMQSNFDVVGFDIEQLRDFIRIVAFDISKLQYDAVSTKQRCDGTVNTRLYLLSVE